MFSTGPGLGSGNRPRTVCMPHVGGSCGSAREAETASEIPEIPMTKRQRQHVIGQLLGDHAVSSQARLVELLAVEGVEATQATVSRDLEEIGAVKVRVPGGDTVYAVPELPTEQHLPVDHLRRVLGEWAVEVAHSHNLVMVRTPPGSAHVVGSALDRRGLPGVLGTVAGDDTIMVVADESTTGAELAQALRDIAGLE